MTDQKSGPDLLQCLVAAMVLSMWGATARCGDRVSFARDIRPILSDRCYRCHGPDRLSRKADLRLDTEEGMYGDRGGYQVAVPGKPDDSEIILRITSDDESYMMPPPESQLSLKPQEIAKIHEWVEQGAVWEKHWSFLTPVRPKTPEVRQSGWPRNAIDAFILRRLEAEGLKPSPQADRRTLIRRVSFDLTGLPPTPEEVNAFLSDDSPDAYEKVVDRLMNSPRFGERMALPWLDASRYADTSGYQEDYGRYMYPWRTWVINAINDNMPFDQFVTDQMAGDLLPNATPEQVLATAYNRNHRINQEVGSINEEFLVEYAVDRLETTSTMFLGLTVGCARCHEHKYDPISHEEFYKLYAFFNNNDENGVDQQSRFGFCKPYIEYPTAQQKDRLADLEARLAAVSESSGEAFSAEPAFLSWLDQFHDLTPLSAGNWFLIGPFPNPHRSQDEGFKREFPPERKEIDLQSGYGKLQWRERPDLVDGRIHTLGMPGATVYLYREVLSPADTKLTLSLGSSVAFKVWVNGELALSKMVYRKVAEDQDEVTVPLHEGPNTILLKFTGEAFDYGFYVRPVNHAFVPPAVFAVLTRPPEERTHNELRDLYQHFREQRVASARRDIEEYRDTFPKVMIMKEREKVRPAHVLNRGLYSSPGERVERDTLSVLPPFPADEPRNRLGLARWLTSPENPLTARVTVNRYWQMYFGTGLVKTAENFGSQGEWPSHPELIDWLAVEFLSSGWNVKHLQRLIVTSATYRQSSASSKTLQEKDPENRLLTRGPRFRLEPQFIRDQALYVSGLLVERVGGPSVKPYQPAGLWEEVSNLLLKKEWYNTNVYVQDHGEDLYRRSLYTFWKRAVPPPNMAAFDAGTREACSVRMQITNTPLQALSLENGVTYVEAARHLAGRVLDEAGDTEADRLAYGMELVTGRPPASKEREILARVLDRNLRFYRQNPNEARELLSHGDSPISSAHNAATHAAYTQVALFLLNLDETITKQ